MSIYRRFHYEPQHFVLAHWPARCRSRRRRLLVLSRKPKRRSDQDRRSRYFDRWKLGGLNWALDALLPAMRQWPVRGRRAAAIHPGLAAPLGRECGFRLKIKAAALCLVSTQRHLNPRMHFCCVLPRCSPSKSGLCQRATNLSVFDFKDLSTKLLN